MSRDEVIREAGRSLHHYGWSTDTPDHLRALVDGDAPARRAAIGHIAGGAVIHQDTFSPVAPAVFDILTDLVHSPVGAVAEDAGHRAELVGVLGWLIDQLDHHGDTPFEEMAAVRAAGQDLDAVLAEARDAGLAADDDVLIDNGNEFHAQAAVRCHRLKPAVRAAAVARLDDPDAGVRAAASAVLSRAD